MCPLVRETARTVRLVAIFLLYSMIQIPVAAAADSSFYKIDIVVGDGNLAQPTGTILQVEDQSSRIRLTAGIERSYNTNSQSDPKQLSVSFDDGAPLVAGETFAGAPSVRHGSLFRLHGRTFVSDSLTQKIHEYDPARKTWDQVSYKHVSDLYCGADAELCASLGRNCGQVLDVNRTVLRMRRCVAVDGRLVWLAYGLTEFAGVGPLNLAPVYASDEALVLAYITDPGAGTGVVVCRHKSGLAESGDCIRAPYEDLQDFPYSIVDTGAEIVVFSTFGSVKRFNLQDKSVSEIRKANEPLKNLGTTSYQIYSSIAYGTDIFLGGYPFSLTQKYKSDGNIVDFDAPLPQTFNYGEVQTATFFKNRLLSGTWPWGQLWSWDFADHKWTLVDRLFTHPDLNALTGQERTQEPYVQKAGGNQLGQRIVSMKKDGDTLYVMTGAKDGYMKDFAAKAGLSDAQLNEYGAVHKLTASGQLALSLEDNIRAGDHFTIEVTENYLRVFRNGRPIGSVAVTLTDSFCLKNMKTGTGIFGDWTGGGLAATVTGTGRCG